LTLQEAYRRCIFQPLELENTYLVAREEGFVPRPYYKDTPLQRDRFVISCGASGGGVTTARELMIFLKAFWAGTLFNQAIFAKLAPSRKLQMSFYPIAYAGGYMRIEAGYPLRPKKVLRGHSGSTESFAYYAPQDDLFL